MTDQWLCVAAGIPFFGMKTFRGTVVYADYENGLDQGRDLRERLVRFLELPKPPENFLVWKPDHAQEGLINLEAICQARPSLLIIDTVRSHSPHFEKSEHAGEEMKQLNTFAHKYGVAILVIHRLRKPSENGSPSLDNDDTGLMLWLKQAAGPHIEAGSNPGSNSVGETCPTNLLLIRPGESTSARDPYRISLLP